ncbi:MAG: amine dehydrogenase large subunit [Betaproteobacteria bacterium]
MKGTLPATAVACAMAWGGSAFAAQSLEEMKDLPPAAKLMGEQHTIAKLPAPHPKRVFVLEPLFPAIVASKIWVIEGDEQELGAVMSAGYCANMALAPDQSEIYVFDTYWDKGFRGRRSDFITTYDSQDLTIKSDTDLPKGRFLVVPKKQNADASPDGKWLFSYNLAPATTVSVIDAKTKKYAGEVEIAGCGLIFPGRGNRFSSVCSDGTLATAQWDDKFKSTVTRQGPFFDSENDPVFEHAGFDRRQGKVHFITYDGNVIPVDIAQDKPAIGTKWSLLGAEDAKEEWRPGGWQLAAVHRATQRLFVLMHKGPKWTHKQAGEEVWVFDLNSRKRVQRIELKEHATTIAVSQDADPYLFTQTEKPSLITYNVQDGKEVGEMSFGITPFLMFVGDE